MKEFLGRTLAALILAGSVAQAQSSFGGGSQYIKAGTSSLGTNIDSLCRVAGFSSNNQYYLACATGTSTVYPVGPTPTNFTPVVCTGTFSMVSGAPGNAVDFSDATILKVPGVPVDTNPVHSAAAVVSDHPYIFQFKYPAYTKTPTLLNAYYEPLILPGPANTQPHFAGASSTGTVTSSMVKSVGSLFDVASAALGDKMYLFLLAGPGTSPNGIQVWSYDGNRATGPVQETNYTFAGATDPAIGPYLQSIDACDIQLQSGEQAILVSAVYNRAGISLVELWLFKGGATGPTTLQPWTMSDPPGQPAPSYASSRIVYGSGFGGAKANVCSIFYSILQPVFPSAGVAAVYGTQIGLPPSLESGSLSQLGDWQEEKGLFGPNARNSAGSEFPYAWTLFPVSAPFGKSYNGYSSVAQYIAEFQKGVENIYDLHARVNYMISSLGEEFLLNPQTAGQTWNSNVASTSTMTPSDAKAAVETWNLLGIITGLPPLPKNVIVPNTRPILSLTYLSSATTSQQVNHTTVVSTGVDLGDDVLSVSSTFKNAARSGNTNSNTVQLDLSLTFNSEANDTYDNDQQVGFLIASAPQFVTGHYNLYAWDGATSLGISTETIATSGTTIETVPFYLNNPSTPISGYPACIYASFPVDGGGAPLVTYPEMTDIEGWKRPYVLTDTAPLIPGYTTSLDFQGTPYVATTASLFTSSSNSYTSGTSSTVEVGGSVSFLGIDVSHSSKVVLESDTSTTFTTGTSTQIRYPLLTYPSTQTGTVYTLVDLNAYLYRLGNVQGETPNWMPSLFQGSQPWLLTWQVTDTGTGTPNTSGNGGSSTGSGGNPGHGPHGKDHPGKGDSDPGWFGGLSHGIHDFFCK